MGDLLDEPEDLQILFAPETKGLTPCCVSLELSIWNGHYHCFNILARHYVPFLEEFHMAMAAYHGNVEMMKLLLTLGKLC